jgi:hypothetical protein
MPSSWLRALSEYQYQVDLRKYAFGKDYPDWFNTTLATGNREETILFENRFRERAGRSLEAWYEVVFWKVFSNGLARNATTQRVINRLSRATAKPVDLERACFEFIAQPSRKSFENLKSRLNQASSGIALAATFPAFLAPDRFPMVDTRVARWVRSNFQFHNSADYLGPQLIPPQSDPDVGTLKMKDFDFYMTWIHWCRNTARKLTHQTELPWRPRDVEMAVFTAWGRGKKAGADLHLNSLPALKE